MTTTAKSGWILLYASFFTGIFGCMLGNVPVGLIGGIGIGAVVLLWGRTL